MKKFFTLIAAVAMAASVNAQASYVTSDADEKIAAGTTLIDDAGLGINVKTVYDSDVSKDAVTVAGKSFTARFNLRIDSNLDDSNPVGTKKDGSTPLVVTATKNVDLTIYGRRQKGSNGFDENDNKDMLMINQSNVKTNLTAKEYVVEEITTGKDAGNYANFKKTYSLEPGTYTVYRKGSTMGVFAIEAAAGAATGISFVEAAASAKSGKTYNIAGQEVSSSYKGLVIKNGKKYVK